MHVEGCRAGTELFSDTLQWVADQRRAHPVLRYLDALTWDLKPRLDTWLADYVGAEDTDHSRLVGRKWLIAAVRRVRQPGTKFDNMLVLEGPENLGKSMVFEKLASSDWFTDNLRMGDDAKVVIENTAGKWIVEIAEMEGMSRRDVETTKSFVSRQVDCARAAYGRFANEVPRQFVLGATTNDAQYLISRTGNRRFWCVTAGTLDTVGLSCGRRQQQPRLMASLASARRLPDRVPA